MGRTVRALIIPTFTDVPSHPAPGPLGSPLPALPMLICQPSDMASLWTACFSVILNGSLNPHVLA